MLLVLLDIFGNILGENQDTMNPSSLQKIQRCFENGKVREKVPRGTCWSWVRQRRLVIPFRVDENKVRNSGSTIQAVHWLISFYFKLRERVLESISALE